MERVVKEFLFSIASYADQVGIRVGLVGGAVRDILLEKESFDIDIIVEADAIEFVDRFFPSDKYRRRFYKYFRTANLWVEGIGKVDFASARQERYLYCASRPQIRFSSIEEDLFRRDYTINAMVFLLQMDKENPLGDFIDLYGGREDLKSGILRVLHNRSFCDDPIRILRGFRYVVRFGFDFSEDTKALLRQAKELGYLLLVPKNRLRDEFSLIKKEANADKILSLVEQELGIRLEDMV